MVGPLFHEWYRFMPTKLGRAMLKSMQKNRDSWERVLAEMDAEKEQEKENNHLGDSENVLVLKKNHPGNGVVIPTIKSPHMSLESINSEVGSLLGLENTDCITETHYELAPEEDTLDVPIRLQLRRHSLPPNINNKDFPTTSILVRRQSFPHTGGRPLLPKLSEKTVSYQEVPTVYGGAEPRSTSCESLQARSRITSLSTSMDIARVTASSPPPGELQRYLSTRRASFPLQKTVSRTTFTSTRNRAPGREPLAQLNTHCGRGARYGRHLDNMILEVRAPDRLSQKRFSDPGMQIPAYLLRSLESKLAAQADASSTEEVAAEGEDAFSYRTLRLPLRRFSLEGREEITYYERTSGK